MDKMIQAWMEKVRITKRVCAVHVLCRNENVFDCEIACLRPIVSAEFDGKPCYLFWIPIFSYESLLKLCDLCVLWTSFYEFRVNAFYPVGI